MAKRYPKNVECDGEREKSMIHLCAECKKLAQKEYKQRQSNIARIVPLKIWLKFRLVWGINWYSHKTESAFENDQVKILWDFNVQTDYVIENRRPNITILYKTEVK